MNVIYFLDHYPKISETFILNEIYALEKQGHNVAVFALSNPNEQVKHEELQDIDIPVHYSKTPSFADIRSILSRKIIHWKSLSYLSLLRKPFEFAAGLFWARDCADYIESLDIDVDLIHGHFATHKMVGAMVTAAYFDIPCTATAHAHEIFDPPSDRYLLALLNELDRIIVPPEYNKKYLIEKIGTSTPIDNIPACVRPEKFQVEDNSRSGRLLTIARLTEKKGIEYAIRSVATLVEDYPSLEYHIIGTGTQRQFLEQLIDKYNLGDTVTLLGNVSDSTLGRELGEAQIFVLPCVIAEDGDRDAMPVVLKEAMATRTPVVSTMVSAIPELIKHRENGILVEARNVTQLSEEISILLNDPEKCRQLGEKGRNTIEFSYDIDHRITDLIESFDSAINRK